MSNLKLSIVIPVYNNVNFTKSCLIDLNKLNSNNEIIIVDDASSDNTEQIVKNFERVKYIKNSSNLGFAKSVNIGYSHSSSDNVLFLNNDIRVKDNFSNWTDDLINECNQYLIGPTGGLLDKQGNFIRETNNIVSGNFYMSGWCLASSKANWSKLILPNHVGPFSEEFGKAYFEDSDLGLRAAELKIPFKIVSIPVVHFGHITTKKLGLSILYKSAQKIFKEKWSRKLK